MAGLGIETGADLAARSEAWLEQHFGSFAHYLYKAARGIDDRRVNPSRERKSLGGELTYFEDKRSDEELRAALDEIIEIVWERIGRYQTRGRTLVLKARYSDFQTITRSRSPGHVIADKAEFATLGHQLLDLILPAKMGIRLLGLTLSGIVEDEGEAQATANKGRSAVLQQELPFDNVEN
jgi:DNA polymerase-4